jgi:nitroimidazol reductase NimA-like FMN-containing flavoprotein (pyridoxamine 5'-phosphate oxidase superfamily)
MKAAVYHRYGPPDVVTIADIPRPAPRDGEILVRVHAATVGVVDRKFVRTAHHVRGFRMPTSHPFDVEAFLALPLTARLATAGPSIRPVWYLWEDGSFWILTGPWATLAQRVKKDSLVALVIDTCDLATGEVRQVTVKGHATVEPYDPDRARRKLRRYLGPDERTWDERFASENAGGSSGFIRVQPDSLTASDLSFHPCSTRT